ncbi:hypothetical protein COMNV_00138 [Commensalibacter sp. Nvir]|nr:hypothetical protein COMNV_00138 [Commensalibacter sp. Nvir]
MVTIIAFTVADSDTPKSKAVETKRTEMAPTKSIEKLMMIPFPYPSGEG